MHQRPTYSNRCIASCVRVHEFLLSSSGSPPCAGGCVQVACWAEAHKGIVCHPTLHCIKQTPCFHTGNDISLQINQLPTRGRVEIHNSMFAIWQSQRSHPLKHNQQAQPTTEQRQQQQQGHSKVDRNTCSSHGHIKVPQFCAKTLLAAVCPLGNTPT